jgi:hypothetical protein
MAAESEKDESTTFVAAPESDYFNGFSLAVGAGDVAITLLRQSKPLRTLHASYTVAKTLADALSNSIKNLEATTNHTIMTIQEVNSALEKRNDQKPK